MRREALSNVKLTRPEEIDLGDCIAIIINERKIIFRFVIFFVFFGLILSLFLPRVYESSVIVRIGFAGEPLLKKPNMIVELPTRKILMPVFEKLKIKTSLIKNPKKILKIEDVPNTDMIIIRTRFSSCKLAKKIAERVVSDFILAGQGLYDAKIAFLKEQVRDLENRQKFIKADFNRMRWRIMDKTKDVDVLTAYEKLELELDGKIFDLKKQLLFSKNFEAVDSPVFSCRRIMPNYFFLIVIFANMGFFCGLFYVFGREFRNDYEKKHL